MNGWILQRMDGLGKREGLCPHLKATMQGELLQRWREPARGRRDTPRSAGAIHVSGSYAYFGETEWLRVYDVSSPSAPREVAAHETPSYAERLWELYTPTSRSLLWEWQ